MVNFTLEMVTINNTKGSFIIREANIGDLTALVTIHIISFNATYPTYHPKPTQSLREFQWKKAFEEKQDNWFCYVAEKESGGIVGFATGHDFHYEELAYEGQLDKIHFLKEYQRVGLGRILVGHVVHNFLSKGFNSMILFADPDNPNIKFYDILGGQRLMDKDGNFQGAFGWKDLKALIEKCPISGR